MDIPNELIILIFKFIKKITDKRQFLKTCKLHNTLLKGFITEISESELDYFEIIIDGINESYNLNENSDHVDIFEKKLYYHRYLSKRNYCVEKFMMELCYDEYFNMIPLSYLSENMDNTVIIKLLIKYGKLELLQLAITRELSKLRICELAAESGQLNILKWLLKNGYDWEQDRSICATASLNGHFDVLKWVRKNYFEWDKFTCSFAARNGHLDILKWARENGCEWDELTCAYAAKNGHLNVLKWARENGCEWNDKTCTFAARNGHLHVLKWARENGCEWDSGTCSLAAANNHLDVLIWARENGCEWDENTILNAIECESFDTLKWARENGCPE